MKNIPDNLWKEIKKILPQKNGGVGRPESDNKKAIEGIFFILDLFRNS